MSNKIPQSTLSLRHFLLRAEVISLYRTFLRTAKEIPDEKSRQEMIGWIRQEFKANKHLTDETSIKMMIQYGQRGLKEVESSVGLVK
ncbi:hypothetical protein WDU94_010697 [Cyamophila willieti]